MYKWVLITNSYTLIVHASVPVYIYTQIDVCIYMYVYAAIHKYHEYIHKKRLTKVKYIRSRRTEIHSFVSLWVLGYYYNLN